MFTKISRIGWATLLFSGMICSTVANAGLISVSKITIQNAINKPLQVSEVVAWGTASASDLALSSAGASASATNYLQSFNGSCKGSSFGDTGSGDADCVIDGAGPLSYYSSPFTYHSQSNSNILSVILSAPSELEWFEILGRSDTNNRDVYTVTFYDAQDVQLHQASANANNTNHRSGQIELPNTAVPNPATLALFGLGLAGLGFSRRKKA